jgi:hypothetical protein
VEADPERRHLVPAPARGRKTKTQNTTSVAERMDCLFVTHFLGATERAAKQAKLDWFCEEEAVTVQAGRTRQQRFFLTR